MIRTVRPMLRRSPLAAAVAALVLVPTFAANAAWEAVPEVTLGTDTNTNTRLEENDDGNTSRAFVDAGIGLANITQRGSLTFNPRFTTDRYADSSDDDLQADEFY